MKCLSLALLSSLLMFASITASANSREKCEQETKQQIRSVEAVKKRIEYYLKSEQTSRANGQNTRAYRLQDERLYLLDKIEVIAFQVCSPK